MDFLFVFLRKLRIYVRIWLVIGAGLLIVSVIVYRAALSSAFVNLINAVFSSIVTSVMLIGIVLLGIYLMICSVCPRRRGKGDAYGYEKSE